MSIDPSLYALKLKICTDWKHFIAIFKAFNKEIFPICTNCETKRTKRTKCPFHFAVYIKNNSNFVWIVFRNSG